MWWGRERRKFFLFCIAFDCVKAAPIYWKQIRGLISKPATTAEPQAKSQHIQPTAQTVLVL